MARGHSRIARFANGRHVDDDFRCESSAIRKTSVIFKRDFRKPTTIYDFQTPRASRRARPWRCRIRGRSSRRTFAIPSHRPHAPDTPRVGVSATPCFGNFADGERTHTHTPRVRVAALRSSLLRPHLFAVSSSSDRLCVGKFKPITISNLQLKLGNIHISTSIWIDWTETAWFYRPMADFQVYSKMFVQHVVT